MAQISFDQIHQRVAEFHATHNSPAAVACRAMDTLREALAEMSQRERDEIRYELRALKAELDEQAWQRFGAALAIVQEG